MTGKPTLAIFSSNTQVVKRTFPLGVALGALMFLLSQPGSGNPTSHLLPISRGNLTTLLGGWSWSWSWRITWVQELSFLYFTLFQIFTSCLPVSRNSKWLGMPLNPQNSAATWHKQTKNYFRDGGGTCGGTFLILHHLTRIFHYHKFYNPAAPKSRQNVLLTGWINKSLGC